MHWLWYRSWQRYSTNKGIEAFTMIQQMATLQLSIKIITNFFFK